jgi:hypothetical protein
MLPFGEKMGSWIFLCICLYFLKETMERKSKLRHMATYKEECGKGE